MEKNKSTNLSKNTIKINAILIVFAFLSAFAFTCDLSALSAGNLSLTEKLFVVFSSNGNNYGFVYAILPFAFFFCYKYLYKYFNKYWLFIVISLCFGFITVWGEALSKTQSLKYVFGGLLSFASSALMAIGYAILYHFIICFLYAKFTKTEKFDLNENPKNLIKKVFDEKPFLICSIIIFVCYLPYLISFFPGTLNNDSYIQMHMILGKVEFTSHHPPLSTYLMSGVVLLGKKIWCDNFGFFLFVLIQTLSMALTFAYTIKFLQKFKTPYFLRIIILLVYCLVPMYPIFATCVIKDTLFLVAFIWYVLFLIDMALDYKTFFSKKSKVILFALTTLLLALLRNNGIYSILFTDAILVIVMLAKKLLRGEKKLKKIQVLSCFLVPVILFFIVTSIIYPAMGIKDGSRKEMLSFPAQQTARYIKEYGDEISISDKKIIDKVFEYDVMADSYNPNISDPVKVLFREDATTGDIVKYFGVWIKQLFRHPLVYLEATASLSYGYFYPGVNNLMYYQAVDMDNFESLATQYGMEVEFNQPDFLNPLSSVMIKCMNVFKRIPILGLTVNAGAYFWFFVILIAFAIKDKKYKFLLPLLPIIMNVFICVLSPAFFMHPRYAYPMLWTMPFIFAFFVYLFKGNKESIESKVTETANKTAEEIK